LGFRVWGFMVYGLWFMVYGSEFRVWVTGFRVWGFGFMVHLPVLQSRVGRPAQVVKVEAQCPSTIGAR
jgi:hypothetical protein